jgi:hypothetical protein
MFGRLRSQGKESTPSGLHAFVPPSDPRSGLALGSGTYANDTRAIFSVAAASTQRDHCCLTGCGKSRQDPIHWPAE